MSTQWSSVVVVATAPTGQCGGQEPEVEKGQGECEAE